MTVTRYIALSLISRYLSMDPTNRDISGLHCIMDARTSTVGSPSSNSRRDQQPGTSHSERASTQWRRCDTDLPVIKPSCVEALRALFRTLGYIGYVAERMMSTSRPSSINLYEIFGNDLYYIVSTKRSMFLKFAVLLLFVCTI